ncbi:MAG: type II secretion system GspH family protein [Muribaculaceae bacterium]|nr:type II secretion system GspH family protein [Muribaculaceae bacterium]
MKKAFTLSEVLVTLGVIGVVAGLTIPGVVKNYRYKTYSAQLRKVYSQLQTAVKMAMEDELSNDFYQTTSGVKAEAGDDTKGVRYFAKKYLKLAREDCGYKSAKKCVADAYLTPSGENAGVLIPDSDVSYCVQTINGATLCFLNHEWTSYITRVAIDVNGPDDPNTIGLDTFVLNLFYQGEDLRDWGDPEDCGVNESDYSGDIVSHAPGCLNKVIANGWVIKD